MHLQRNHLLYQQMIPTSTTTQMSVWLVVKVSSSVLSFVALASWSWNDTAAALLPAITSSPSPPDPPAAAKLTAVCSCSILFFCFTQSLSCTTDVFCANAAGATVPNRDIAAIKAAVLFVDIISCVYYQTQVLFNK